MNLMAGLELVVDGMKADMSRTMSYKGMMYSDVPNLASAFGYTNASWTLKCDLTGEFVCRLINHMDKLGYAYCTPRRKNPAIREEPALTFTSGYVQRALPGLPKQGSKRPWRLRQNYALEDGTMEFRR